MIQQLTIDKLECDKELQPRAESHQLHQLHQDWIQEYALAMQAGAKFPPVVVFFDGERYWLADGFHRRHAAEAAGRSEIDADVRHGTRRDALLYSLSANAEHGHRRTNEDKRRAVDIMLDDPEWEKLPDLEIAKACMVTHPFVAKRRRAKMPTDDVAEADDCNDYNGSKAEQFDQRAAEEPDHDIEAPPAAELEATAAGPVELFDRDAAQAIEVARQPGGHQQDLTDVPEVVLENDIESSKAMSVDSRKPGAGLPTTPGTRRFGMLYADPWSAMTLDDLVAQPIPAADDCVIFLRAPRVDDALRLMEGWGFDCAGNVVWNKGGSELGYCVRYQHELYLIGTRGAILKPEQGMELPSILSAASDNELADSFAAMFPNLPKARLFTHTPRAGWDAWHPDVDSDGAAEAHQPRADLAEPVREAFSAAA